MAQRLPTHNEANWDTILEGYLGVSLNTDGTFKSDLSPIFNVKTRGAVGNGSTDDTAAIQAVINSAVAVGGGTVFFPAGIYVVNGSLVCQNQDDIFLRGSGAAHAIYEASPTTGTIFKRTSGTGAILSFGATGTNAQWVRGGGISGITFDGNVLAATCLKITSVKGGTFRDLHLRNGTTVCLDLATVDLAGADDLQSCLIDTITVRVGDTGADSGIGIRMDSASDGIGNVSINNFQNIQVLHKNGVGVQMLDTDTNTIYGLSVNRAVGGTGIGLEFGASNAASGHARYNAIYNVQAVGGVTARATGFSTPSQKNVIYGLNRGNASPVPTIESGADLKWTEVGGGTFFRDRDDILNAGLGIVAESVSPPHGAYTAFGMVTQAVYGVAVGLRQGDVITKIGFPCAAVGSGVTLFKMGLYDKTGVLLGSTADVKASLTANVVLEGALSSSYAVPADDLYYLVALGVGATPPSGMRANVSTNLLSTGINGGRRRCWAQTGQADLPAPATINDNGTANMWLIAIGTPAN